MTSLAAVRPRIIEITIAQFRSLSCELSKQHYAEITQDKRHPLDPDWPTYERLEAAGLFLCLGAFVGDEFVGYALTFICQRNMHYDFGFAQNDVFFVTKSHRGKQHGSDETIGDMLRAETKRLAKERGAVKVTWHAKKGTAMDRWLAGKGCKVADIVYVEDL